MELVLDLRKVLDQVTRGPYSLMASDNVLLTSSRASSCLTSQALIVSPPLLFKPKMSLETNLPYSGNVGAIMVALTRSVTPPGVAEPTTAANHSTLQTPLLGVASSSLQK